MYMFNAVQILGILDPDTSLVVCIPHTLSVTLRRKIAETHWSILELLSMRFTRAFRTAYCHYTCLSLSHQYHAFLAPFVLLPV